ncbi:MAG: hypothetical protein OXF65_08230 [Acidimicrobiaceae bacterium]|nr:hypothetical protein [Acidimicrobiaceae bacterium]
MIATLRPRSQFCDLKSWVDWIDIVVRAKPRREAMARWLVEERTRLDDLDPTLWRIAEHGYRRVGGYGCLKCIGIMHFDQSFHGVLVTHQLAQPGSVLVAHPAVSANEAETATRAQERQAPLEEPDEEVRSSSHRRTR